MATASERIADLAAGLWDKPLLASTLRLAARVVATDPAFVVETLDRAIADGRARDRSRTAHDLLGQAREIARGEV